jgi:elongation factor P
LRVANEGAAQGSAGLSRSSPSNLRSTSGDRALAAASLRAVISTNQFKNGTHIEVDGRVFRIVEFQHVKPGKGGAFVRSKLKRVDDGAVIDKTFKAGEKFRPVRTETRKMQFLYDSGEAAVFMDNQSYEQVEIPKSIVGDALKWIPPNSDVDLLFVDERAAGAQPPSAVDLAITQTDPGLKGDTASGGGTKPATLETGVTVQVPLFIEEGERVRVDTRSGEYVSRA